MSPTGGEALPGAWGRFRFEPRAARGSSGAIARSYVSDGGRLSWFPREPMLRTCAVACDIEDQARIPSEEISVLAERGAWFHRFWVLGELAAKLTDVPMLELLVRYRRGTVPRFARGTRALVMPGWAGRYTVGFACMPLAGCRSVHWQAARRDWGFRRITEAGRSASRGAATVTAAEQPEEHRDG